MNCRRCKRAGKDIEMVKSQAMSSTWRGVPDFPGDTYAVTLSPGGPGRLVDCLKCPECGWSVSV